MTLLKIFQVEKITSKTTNELYAIKTLTKLLYCSVT